MYVNIHNGIFLANLRLCIRVCLCWQDTSGLVAWPRLGLDAPKPGRLRVRACVCVFAIHRVIVFACVSRCRSEPKTAERRKDVCLWLCVCVCVCGREGRSCVCTHEMELHGCAACATKRLSWITYKAVNVNATRELIQRTHWWKLQGFCLKGKPLRNFKGWKIQMHTVLWKVLQI